MKLQRYEPHIYASLLGESRTLFEASYTGMWVKADEAIAEIAALKAQIEQMRCCGNCKYDKDFDCEGCVEGYTKWEPAK